MHKIGTMQKQWTEVDEDGRTIYRGKSYTVYSKNKITEGIINDTEEMAFEMGLDFKKSIIHGEEN